MVNKIRNLEEYNQKFSGRVGVAIGSGFSIHFQDLSSLSEHVTIAVNSGFCAFPQADFFLSDDWSISRWNFFGDQLKKAKATVLLYEDKLRQYNLFGDRTVWFRHRKGYHISSIYEHTNYDNFLLQCRSSLATAIGVLYVMGCSKVVVLGLDCRRYETGERYFWQFSDQPKNRIIPTRNDGIPNDNFRKCRHQGIKTDSDLKEIKKYWESQTSDMRKKIKIYNASQHTALDIFPKMSLEDALEK
ncbi:hypothetical protein LCGC14_0870780 [marine sediment metagenome]|uniref:DUF115 domain-containing protein n=1 Tax=marine sediment metagenome TaxID=412755 RepID=A0A0F9P9M3_9ZZZZ